MHAFVNFLILLAMCLVLLKPFETLDGDKKELYPDKPVIYEAYFSKDYKYDIPFYMLNNPDFSILYYQ